jgi:hypothetical protein
MKFVSKNSNLLIVLAPGIPAQPLSGTPAKSGLYIKFKNGIAEVKDEDIIAKMKAHDGFDRDFIAVEDEKKDPYQDYREDQEPTHVISEIKYGHVEKSVSGNKKIRLTKEMSALVNQLAMEKVKELLPGMVEETLKSIAKQSKAKEEKKEEVTEPQKEE